MPLMKTRALLENITPLKSDCGRVCGAACCEPLQGEETGMLLFPGEEKQYEGLDGYTLKRTVSGQMMVICCGRCNRAERPLACRMFPLLPVIREDGVHVAIDARSRAVCPLSKGSVHDLAPEFVSAVHKAGELLAEDEACRAFLIRLTEEHDELKRLRKLLKGASRHV